MDIGSATLLAHYRLRPPRLTTTITLDAGDLVTTVGARSETQALRALFLLDSDDPETVVDVARQLPAVRMGARLRSGR